MTIYKTSTTFKKAVRASYPKGIILYHGNGDYSVNGNIIHVWGNQNEGYTISSDVARFLNLKMIN